MVCFIKAASNLFDAFPVTDVVQLPCYIISRIASYHIEQEIRAAIITSVELRLLPVQTRLVLK